MSVFGDFQRVWVQRFPDSALPAAWEEDVRANLAKHKQKVAILREELEKEEFYVEYLERLLSDVEKHKNTSTYSRSTPPPLDLETSNDLKDKDVEGQQVFKSDGINSTNKCEVILKDIETSTTVIDNEEVLLRSKHIPTHLGDRNTVNQCISEISTNLKEGLNRRCTSEIETPSGGDNAITVASLVTEHLIEKVVPSVAGDFVTVIEVNGVKTVSETKVKKSEQTSPGSTSSPVEHNIPKKKVPPRPPPKVFSKRGATLPEPQSDESPPTSLSHRLQSADSKESLGSHSSSHGTSSINERMKSYESINSLSSERKFSGGAATPHSETGNASVPADQEEESLSLESIPATLPGSEDDKDEPFYDSVPLDSNDGEYVYIQAGGTNSSNDDVSSNSSTLPLAVACNTNRSTGSQHSRDGPESPTSTSNYVNIDYFIQHGGAADGAELEGAVVVAGHPPTILRSISTDTTGSSTPLTVRKLQHQDSASSNSEAERLTMHRCIVSSIIESETVYVECLYVMEKYMNAIKATLNSSQPVITEEEFNTIFYKISELHTLHKSFLEGLKEAVRTWDEPLSVGIHFKKMAENINVYGAFLHNYGRATDAVRRRSAGSPQFADLTRHISCRGRPCSLDDLLHKPVARVQKNALVLHDLLKYTPVNHPDHLLLTEALNMTQHFLDEFNIIQTKSMFPSADRAQRRLVKNSFIVELSDGHRKLRHLFLFNDVIACAKYKASGRDKFTFELKWFVPLGEAQAAGEDSVSTEAARENSPANIVALKTQASTVRDQLAAEERSQEDKKMRLGGRGAAEKQRKKLAELEAQLVLASPNLIFKISCRSPPATHLFFLSSEYERTQWIESIHGLQASSQPPPGSVVSMLELQAWVTACRSYLQTDMGSYLLRSGKDDGLLLGDLHVTLVGLTMPLETPLDLYIVIEVDSYGHYFRKAKSKLICKSVQPRWNEAFVIELEGSQNLRLLMYEDSGGARPILRGKCTLKLSRSWAAEGGGMRTVTLSGFTGNTSSGVSSSCGTALSLKLRLLPPEVTMRRVPTAKAGALFGAKIQTVCKREKRDIPFIITSCVREVERRGIHEVGVYRVSGSASDLHKLRKSFETNSYEAEQLLKEVDIHSVTGVLKLYLRELPEALFTDALYPEFFKVWGAGANSGLQISNESGPTHSRHHSLLKLFTQLPELNRKCIDFLLNHFVRVNQQEAENKMSLHNLATVFGPTLLHPSSSGNASAGSSAVPRGMRPGDPLAAGTVDVMAQAGILYCLLQQRQLAAQLRHHTREP